MRTTINLLLLLVLAYTGNGQTRTSPPKPSATPAASEYATIDKKALEIPAGEATTTQGVARYINSGFGTQKEKIRAIFIWTASSFEYDVDNMYALNFHEKEQDKIDKIMRLRKGICENYAAVFHDLCQKCGLTSWLIGGYTRHNGQTSDLPHQWCAAQVDGQYYIFDPTWGSGYISNNKFTRRIDNTYFMSLPADIIRTHMPFDPMWQFLNYPVTTQEFAEGRTEVNRSKPFFSYPDSIAAHEKLPRLQQYEAEARRMEQNGIKTPMAFNYFSNLKHNIDVERQNRLVNVYNAAVTDLNSGVRDLNNFINYRNRQFTPARTDAEIQGMLDTVDRKMLRVQVKLNSIRGQDVKIDELAGPLEKNMDEVNRTLIEQKDFLQKYLSKGKTGRKSMFYKYTWMGIPLN
ncbi:hypothetical protein GCM10023093_04820 [Nemorincola caseinilytica]|uniref:Transglutaminase-like domain-containing protein n=1 Tax=Nemorincola caseinilytica TaxID=2054315 RepID=A0ABP8N443_9BACT